TIAQKFKDLYCRAYYIEESAVHVAPSASLVNQDFDTIPVTCEQFKESLNIGYIGKAAKSRGLETIRKVADHFPNIMSH
ncbi:hypothetical protein ACOTWI_11230, partial [Aliarcobacter butzleri]